MVSRRFVKGIGIGMISTLLWAGFYPMSRALFGYEEDSVDALNVSVIRFIAAALFLMPLFFRRENRRKAGEMLQRHWRLLIALGGIGIVGEGLFVFWALKYTTAARASLIANTSPISTLLISYFSGREMLTKRNVSGMTLGFLGLILLFAGQGEDLFSGNASTLAGDLMALLSGICWAVYTVYGDTISQKYGGMLSCELLFLVGLCFMIPLAFIVNGGINLRLPLSVWGGIFYLGVLSYGVANSLWYVALKYVTPGELGTLGYISALLALVFSIFFTGEKVSLTFIISFVIVLTGVGLMLGGNSGDSPSAKKHKKA